MTEIAARLTPGSNRTRFVTNCQESRRERLMKVSGILAIGALLVVMRSINSSVIDGTNDITAARVEAKTSCLYVRCNIECSYKTVPRL